jgi:molybdate transport system substrate-binding protein
VTVPRGIAAAMAAWLAAWPACGAAAPERVHVHVSAAASLTAPFTAIAAAFEREHPALAVALNFAGTPQLLAQLEAGHAADVLATADEPSMARAAAAGRTAGAPVLFASNRLAVLVRAGNPKGIRSAADLARDDLRVALCAPAVPAGRYAREALHRAGIAVRSLSDEPSVKALAAKIALGELDAGIGYVTDARAPGLEAVALGVPAEAVPRAGYPIAVLAAGGQRDAAAAFVAFVSGDRGRAILREHGFEVP